MEEGQEEKIAALLLKQNTPTILLTKRPVADPKKLGARGFLFKPIGIQKLHDACVALADNTSPAEEIKPELHHLRTQLRNKNPYILIAEDNPVNRMLLNSLLQEHAQVDTVTDGLQALEACQNNPYQLILLDLQMPYLDGLEAAKKIRSESRFNRSTPIVIISASNNPVPAKTLKRLEIELFLQKPIDESQLLSHLIKLLKKTPPPAIDWQQCMKKVSGNKKLAEDYLTCFVQELHFNRQEFIQLQLDNDLKGLENAAHKLHGACCYCGVPNLQNYVMRLEKQAKIATDIKSLESILSKVLLSIDEVINEFEIVL